MSKLNTLFSFLLIFFLNSTILLSAPIAERTFYCSTSKDVYQALKKVKAGDTIMLEGGVTYEINKSFQLKALGSKTKPIIFSSTDKDGLGRYAIISTVNGEKEDKLIGIYLKGSYWHLSKIEITGKKIELKNNFWDIHGFRIGLYLKGKNSKYNIITDMYIHHTHNGAIIIRDQSHHNTFKRIKIKNIGDWINNKKKSKVHIAEGFYIGSFKGIEEKIKLKAKVHHISIEDSILGPGIIGQFLDFKYASSFITVKNNTFFCNQTTWSEEIIKLAGYASLVKNNKFIGNNPSLKQYILVDYQNRKNRIKVDYLGENNIAAPSGKDNYIIGNNYITDKNTIPVVTIKNESNKITSVYVFNNNIILPSKQANALYKGDVVHLKEYKKQSIETLIKSK